MMLFHPEPDRRSQWRLFTHLSFVALLALAGCGDGNSDNATDNGTGSAYPAEIAIFSAGAAPTFVATFSKARATDISFRFFLVTEEDFMTVNVAESDTIPADENQTARWTPGVELLENQPYTWRWEVTYRRDGATGSFASEPRIIYVLKKNGLAAMSPRDGGYLDLALAIKSHLAVRNGYTFGGPAVKYDFEIYRDRAMTDMISSKSGIDQDNENVFTAWDSVRYIMITGEYFWRARVIIDGVSSDWTKAYSYRLQNLCDLSGSAYAEYVVDWIEYTPCDQLIMTDPAEALGPPSAGGFISQDEPGYGFISMGHNSELILEMGHVVTDGEGDDIGVYEYVSREPVELFAGKSEIGPWYSMGVIWCGTRCDFDLAVAGVSYAKYFKIRSMPGRCYQTAGPDIHSLEALNMTSDAGQCY